MSFARGAGAAFLSLALFSALSVSTHAVSVNAETRHTFNIEIVVDGNSRTVASDAFDVAGVLLHAGIHVESEDDIQPPLTTPALHGMTIHINHVRLETRTVRTTVPAPTTYLRSMRMLPGNSWQWKPGSPGIKEEHIRVAMLGSRVVHQSVLESSWVRHPAERVVIVGVSPFQETSRSFSGLSRPFTMIASEYDVYLGGAGSGRTRTGTHARRGIVAIDPRVIPLGTHLYVEGYGLCTAEDTGGAIKGRRIDLCVPSTSEANRYGLRKVHVVIVPRG
jgi:3D (Asp-Asp-Asp) domain-containing protein